MSKNRNAGEERRGLVSLVGAGPGDPGLLTVKGLARLREADVVVFDRLIAPELLREARAEAERIDVGKAAGDHTVPQERIGALLVERATAGQRVVRLKGGDPFVFGRGGEEAEALAEAGLAFEVVPGVTSAVAAPAYAGIPVTDRRAASSFTVVTGHEAADKSERGVDWEGIARGADTLVVLMGLRALPDVVDRLIAGGSDPATPASSIEAGTTPRQRVVSGTLAELPQRVAEAGLASPVLTVVGEVVALRARLAWFEQRPLFGKRVLVTRTREQASAMVDRLREEGAEPLELPAIRLAPADPTPIREAVRRLAAGSYDWALFTSANGVERFFAALSAGGYDSRALGGVRIGVIGPETGRALRAQGLAADVAPERYVAESLLAALPADLAGARVLLARAAGARDVLPDGLRGRGAEVDETLLYKAVPAAADPAIVAMLEAGEVDVATFASSSTVTHLLTLLGGRRELLAGTLIACIGPVTAATAEASGLQPGVVAETHTIAGLIDALRRHFSRERTGAAHA